METRATETLKLGNTFFVFTHQSLFLVPPNEYERIQQDEDGYVCLERKYITGIASRNTERVICIVCHGKAAPEDLVFPLCRQMHFVICEECVEDLQEKTNKREIFCPYCKEEQDKKASQEKILSAVLSLMSHQTLHSLEINPNTEVETVTRLSQETKVFLSNVCVSDALFFNLLSKTVVEITNRITLFAHDNSLDCCRAELDAITDESAVINIGRYTNQEMKQVYSNIKTIPKKSIRINAENIQAVGNGICVLLKLSSGVYGHVPDLLLEASAKDRIEEILETKSNMAWIGRMENLLLIERAIETLPFLGLHKENKTKMICLCAKHFENVAGILSIENSSVSIGDVKKLVLCDYAVGILPKIRFREENEMESLALSLIFCDRNAEISKTKNNSIWVGKVGSLRLVGHAIQTLPKLRIHEENVMEELVLSVSYEHITEMFRTKNNSIWIGKVKKLELKDFAVQILPKLRFHKENEMEELTIDTYAPEHITEILDTKNRSICVGKVKKLVLGMFAVEILPKLGIHEENVMVVLNLRGIDRPEHITEILKTKDKSIWVGKVRKISLEGYSVGILPKLRMHEENVMEEFGFSADYPKQITETLKTKDKSIWIGRVRKINLAGYAKKIKNKLDFTLISPFDQEEIGSA